MKQGALIAALVIAIAGAALLYLYKQRFEAEVSGGEKIAVMVAASDLKLGDVLENGKVATRGIPAAYVENRHVRSSQLNSVMGVRIRTRIGAGETIMWSDLAISGANSRDLSGRILPRMRAIAIPASAALTFDGLLRPGDRVDVMLTLVNKQTGQAFTKPLLQNLIVLAIGTHMGQASNEAADTNRISTVTLSVKPSQGLLLTNAMQEGRLQILLRNVDDIRLLKDTSVAPAAIPGK